MGPRVWITGWQRGIEQDGQGESGISHYLWACGQSGKATLVRGIAAELGMRYLTFDDPAVRAAAVGDPHGFVRSLGNEAVVLDEFREVPGLVPAIKGTSDLHGCVSPDGPAPGGPRKGLFLLTGSAHLPLSSPA